MQLLTSLAGFAVALMVGLPAFATDWPPQARRMAIHVQIGDWGTAQTQDIEKVLGSVADVLLPYFSQRASDRIVVQYSRQGPQVLFEKSGGGAYRVFLSVQDTRWDQFAYQFSHELCHIFTNFEHREPGRDGSIRGHQWFEETLCEAVSLFALNRLASTWERSPPFPGWNDYAPTFRDYARRLLSAEHRRLPPNESIAAWYRENREDLGRNPYLREKNEQLAVRLLPLLENAPGSLKSIAYLNLEKSISPGSFKAYLESWYRCCPEEYRPFISQVITLFEEGDDTGRAAMALTASKDLMN